MEEKPPVTMLEIATKLGLSKTTVCSALGNTGTISKATREKVKSAALAMGYKVNVLASALANRRSNWTKALETIPVAILHEASLENPNVSNPESLQHAAELGFECHFFDIKEHRNMRSLGRMLHARGFGGIVLARIMGKVDMSQFPWEHFAAVASGRQVNDWPCDMVGEGEENNIRHALQMIKERGYKRPGVCLLRHNQEAIDDWVRVGIALAYPLFAAIDKDVPPFFEKPPVNKDFLAHAMKVQRWYKKYRPDVVIGFSITNYWDLKNNTTLQIPGDTSYIALRLFRDDSWAQGLSGYAFTNSQVLSAVFDRLSYLIRHNRKGLPPYRSQIIIEQPWIEGTTCPYIKA